MKESEISFDYRHCVLFLLGEEFNDKQINILLVRAFMLPIQCKYERSNKRSSILFSSFVSWIRRKKKSTVKRRKCSK